MEELELKEILEHILAKWRFIVICMALFLIMGLVYSFFMVEPMYSSSTTIIINNKSINQEQTVNQSDLMLSRNLVSTYSEIIKSKNVLSRVIDKTGINEGVENISKSIQVTPVASTELLEIKVTNKDAERAANIANTIAEEFSVLVRDIYNVENVSVIDVATISNTPYNISHFRNMAIFTLIGAIVAIGIVFLRFYFDDTIKSSESIEKAIGVTVLATVNLQDNKKVGRMYG